METKLSKKTVADALDLAILRELREDSKQSIRELAQKVGSHPNTLMERIKKLENEKIIIKYSTDIDYRKIGYDMHALVLAKVRKGVIGDYSQLADVVHLPQIQSIYAITGTYDIAVMIRAKDRNELAEVLQKIQKNQIIVKTHTLLVMHTYKQPYEFNPLL